MTRYTEHALTVERVTSVHARASTNRTSITSPERLSQAVRTEYMVARGHVQVTYASQADWAARSDGLIGPNRIDMRAQMCDLITQVTKIVTGRRRRC